MWLLKSKLKYERGNYSKQYFLIFREAVVPILLEPIQKKFVTEEMVCLFATQTYIKWPQRNQRKQRQFWKRLIQTLRPLTNRAEYDEETREFFFTNESIFELHEPLLSNWTFKMHVRYGFSTGLLLSPFSKQIWIRIQTVRCITSLNIHSAVIMVLLKMYTFPSYQALKFWKENRSTFLNVYSSFFQNATYFVYWIYKISSVYLIYRTCWSFFDKYRNVLMSL